MGPHGPATSSSDVCADDLDLPLHERAPADRRATCPCLALRVTYVGELGWELYPPAEYGLRLWDTLVEAGAAVTGSCPPATGPSTRSGWRRATGSGARTSRRETDPFSAGLGFAVRLEKGGFLGWDAVAPLAPDGGDGLACLVLDDPLAVALGNEPVKDGTDVVGRVTSGGRRLLARAVDRVRLAAGRPDQPGHPVSVEVFGETVGAEVRQRPALRPGRASGSASEPASAAGKWETGKTGGAPRHRPPSDRPSPRAQLPSRLSRPLVPRPASPRQVARSTRRSVARVPRHVGGSDGVGAAVPLSARAGRVARRCQRHRAGGIRRASVQPCRCRARATPPGPPR